MDDMGDIDRESISNNFYNHIVEHMMDGVNVNIDADQSLLVNWMKATFDLAEAKCKSVKGEVQPGYTIVCVHDLLTSLSKREPLSGARGMVIEAIDREASNRGYSIGGYDEDYEVVDKRDPDYEEKMRNHNAGDEII